MKNKDFDQFKTRILPELSGLLKELQSDIGDEYRDSDDPNDDTPAMRITIATDDHLSNWTYQTGDSSFSGSCYHYPYWGCGTLTRDSNCSELADELIENLAETIFWED